MKPWFEGGQTPLFKRLPQHKFPKTYVVGCYTESKVLNNLFSWYDDHEIVFLSEVQRLVDIGKLDPSQRVDLKELFRHGIIRMPYRGARLVARVSFGFLHSEQFV